MWPDLVKTENKRVLKDSKSFVLMKIRNFFLEVGCPPEVHTQALNMHTICMFV
jgi:hypothetical protein